MKLNTYLHEYTVQWKNTLKIKEIFTSLRSKIFYLQKRSFHSQGFQNVFNVRRAKNLEKEGPQVLIFFLYL